MVEPAVSPAQESVELPTASFPLASASVPDGAAIAARRHAAHQETTLPNIDKPHINMPIAVVASPDMQERTYEGETRQAVTMHPVQLGPIRVATPVVLSPMAGVTNWPFRVLCEQYGPDGLYVAENDHRTSFGRQEP
jgi:hypothetical protein